MNFLLGVSLLAGSCLLACWVLRLELAQCWVCCARQGQAPWHSAGIGDVLPRAAPDPCIKSPKISIKGVGGCSRPWSPSGTVEWAGEPAAPLPLVLWGHPPWGAAHPLSCFGFQTPSATADREGLENTWWSFNCYPLSLRDAGQAPPSGRVQNAPLGRVWVKMQLFPGSEGE